MLMQSHFESLFYARMRCDLRSLLKKDEGGKVNHNAARMNLIFLLSTKMKYPSCLVQYNPLSP